MDILSAFEQLGPGFYIAFAGAVAAWWYLRSRDDGEEEEEKR